MNPAPLQGPFPNLSLPGHVTAPAGRLTLFADHGHPGEEGVPLYLVNRTSRQVVLPGSASDPGAVLEQYDGPSQNWRSAQSGPHGMGACVDGVSFPLLSPGQHFRLGGYRPSHEATEGKVRFRLDSCDVISNTGSGLWREADVANVRLDPGMLDRHPFASNYGWWIVTSPIKDPQETEGMIVKLGMMKAWEDGPVFRCFSRALETELQKKEAAANPKNAEALHRVGELLAERQATGASPEKLFQHCLEILRKPRENRYASPSRFPGISWMALAWLRQKGRMEWDDRWREVHALLESRLDVARGDEITAMSEFLFGNPLAHEYLPNDFLIRAALANPGLVQACAERLADRGDLAGAIRVSQRADLATRIAVIPYLCVNPPMIGGFRGTLRENDEGERYLLQCVEDGPWLAAEALGRSTGSADSHSLPPRYSIAFREQAMRLAEVARLRPWPDPTGTHLPGMLRVTRNLGLNGRKDDRTLHALRTLAEIRPEGETDEQNRLRKTVAAEARKQLLIAGWDPADPPERESR